MELLFGIPTVPLPNFLCLTLTPSNQIIHPGRMLGVFSKWDGKSPIDPATVPLLYEDMDKVSADLMQELDDEIQAIKVNLISFETPLFFPFV
jgi:opine dehydrogenase